MPHLFPAAFLLLLLPHALSHAVTHATVEAVQSPVWLHRDGARLPVAPGTRLLIGDEVSTGAEARAQIRLADSSLVKLGENALFHLRDMGQSEGIFRAAMQVLEGAFRFTTDTIQRSRIRRDVSVRFGTVTAGVRGTDLWGRNFGDSEVVVLISGEITVTREGEPPVPMRQPLSMYEAPRVGVAEVRTIPIELLREFAAQTEIQPGHGALVPNGRWRLVLAVFEEQFPALQLRDSLRREGYPATVPALAEDGRNIYEVRLGGFASGEEAEALAARLRRMHPGIEPIVTNR
jgi:hypothetical protein